MNSISEQGVKKLRYVLRENRVGHRSFHWLINEFFLFLDFNSIGFNRLIGQGILRIVVVLK